MDVEFLKLRGVYMLQFEALFSKESILGVCLDLVSTGKVIQIDEKNLEKLLECIAVVTGKDYSEIDLPEFKEVKVTHVCVNRVLDMECVTLCLKSLDNEFPEPFKEDYGTGYPTAFSYAVNLDCPYFSEFGDVFFEKRADGFFHRAS